MARLAGLAPTGAYGVRFMARLAGLLWVPTGAYGLVGLPEPFTMFPVECGLG
jgi:hypothetical protein